MLSTKLFGYNLSLLPSSTITHATVANISGQKLQELVFAYNSRIEVWQIDPEYGTLRNVLSHETFSSIRSLESFRLAGFKRDYLIVVSDAGKVSILEYNGESNTLKAVQQETFGKTGIRRIVPGEFLGVDAKGRSFMIASAEKNKLVYVLNRDAQANITISSPLEANKAHNIVFDLLGLDVGYENPCFAAIEKDYGDSDHNYLATGKTDTSIETNLIFYELDLGLNHVVRKWVTPAASTSHKLIQVPGGNDGPSGVLVCSFDWIVYRHPDRPSLRVPIPKRKSIFEDPSRSQIIVANVVHKMKGSFFFLLQTEAGDIFKLSMDYSDSKLSGMTLSYFDTIPPARHILILKSGFLFSSSESGNHQLYQFKSLGEDEPDMTFHSHDYSLTNLSQLGDINTTALFQPRELENLVITDEITAIHPLTYLDVFNFNDEETPQIYALSGRGTNSTIRTIRQGIEVNEIVSSPLPERPLAVWSTKLKSSDTYDSYIVLSFRTRSLVLSIGETVEEVSDTGFLTTESTIAVQQLGDDAIIQIYRGGIRHIQFDKQINEWKPDNAGEYIIQAVSNHRQVVVALNTNELVYFELDEEGQLNEYEERCDIGSEILALGLGDVEEGQLRFPAVSVGCIDNTVRIISLDPETTLDSISLQALSAPPSSLLIVSMHENGIVSLYLHIGLRSGVYVRTIMDKLTGQLTDTRIRFLGPKEVKLFKVKLESETAVLMLCTRTFLAYSHQSSLMVNPLSYYGLEYGCDFSSELCPEGVVGIESDSLR